MTYVLHDRSDLSPVSAFDNEGPIAVGTEFYVNQLGAKFQGAWYYSIEDEDLYFGLFDITEGVMIDTQGPVSSEGTGWSLYDWPEDIDLTIFKRYKVIVKLQSGMYYAKSEFFDVGAPYVQGGLEIPHLGAASNTVQGTFMAGPPVGDVVNPTSAYNATFYYVEPEVQVSDSVSKFGDLLLNDEIPALSFKGHKSYYDRTGGIFTVFGHKLLIEGGKESNLEPGMWYSDGESWFRVGGFNLNEG